MGEGQEARWRPLISLAGMTEDFIHGVEAGMIWQRMTAEEPEICVPVHAAIADVYRRFGAAAHYDIELEPHDEDWAMLTATLRPKRGPLSIVT